MKCPHCGGINTEILDSRFSTDHTYKRRKHGCKTCKRPFNTYEVAQQPHKSVGVIIKEMSVGQPLKMYSGDKLHILAEAEARDLITVLHKTLQDT